MDEKLEQLKDTAKFTFDLRKENLIAVYEQLVINALHKIDEAYALGETGNGNISPACEVCWTTSWAPIPDDYETDINILKHKDGTRAICEYCKLEAEYRKLKGNGLQAVDEDKVKFLSPIAKRNFVLGQDDETIVGYWCEDGTEYKITCPCQLRTRILYLLNNFFTFGTPKQLSHSDAKHLHWIADRLVNVYNESPFVDFVQKLREIADAIIAQENKQ